MSDIGVPNETFYRWLRDQRRRDDAIGDLARDARAARNRPKSSLYFTWAAYLDRMGACTRAKQTLRRAWDEWQAAGS